MELPSLPDGLAHYAQRSYPASWSHADYKPTCVSYPSLHAVIVLGELHSKMYPTLHSSTN